MTFQGKEVRQLNARRQRTPFFLERTQLVRPELQGWWHPTGYYFIPPWLCRSISDSHSEDPLSAVPHTCHSWLLPGSPSIPEAQIWGLSQLTPEKHVTLLCLGREKLRHIHRGFILVLLHYLLNFSEILGDTLRTPRDASLFLP